MLDARRLCGPVGGRDDQLQVARSGTAAQRLLPVGTRRTAGQLEDLEGPLEPLPVPGLDACRGSRVDARQLGVQGRPAVARRTLVDATTQGRVGRRHVRQAGLQRPEVEHGPARQQRDPATRADGGHRRGGLLQETAGRVPFRRVGHVDEVVRKACQGVRVRLGGTDVHAPVHHRGVHAHDLDRQRGG